MKNRILIVLVAFLFVMPTAFSQIKDKRNLTVKEWNTTAGSKSRYLDHTTTYNAKGQKIEETEFANYGQKSRVTYEYNEAGRCVKQVVYDSRNKVIRIRKFEYYEDGSKKKQYNYLPNGKLESTKVFEYYFQK